MGWSLGGREPANDNVPQLQIMIRWQKKLSLGFCFDDSASLRAQKIAATRSKMQLGLFCAHGLPVLHPLFVNN